MKKWLTGSLFVLILVFIAAGILLNDKDKADEKVKTGCHNFVDKNNDAICDKQGTPDCSHDRECRSKHD